MLSRKRQILRILLLMVGLPLLIVVFIRVTLYTMIPVSPIENIVIKGDLRITQSNLQRILGIERWGELNYQRIDTADIREKFERYLLIKSAQIEKIYPDTLVIELFQRQPVATILLRQEQTTIAFVDKDGYLFSSRANQKLELPILTGLNLQAVSPQLRLPQTLLPLLASLEKLKEDESDFFDIISEIEIIFTDDNLITEITLTNYTTRIRSDSQIDQNLLKNALIVLEVMQRGNISTPMIDMRTSGIVYNNSEEL